MQRLGQVAGTMCAVGGTAQFTFELVDGTV